MERNLSVEFFTGAWNGVWQSYGVSRNLCKDVSLSYQQCRILETTSHSSDSTNAVTVLCGVPQRFHWKLRHSSTWGEDEFCRRNVQTAWIMITQRILISVMVEVKKKMCFFPFLEGQADCALEGESWRKWHALEQWMGFYQREAKGYLLEGRIIWSEYNLGYNRVVGDEGGSTGRSGSLRNSREAGDSGAELTKKKKKKDPRSGHRGCRMGRREECIESCKSL